MAGSDDHDLNGLDSKINDRGFFERILKEFKETLKARYMGEFGFAPKADR